VTARLAARVRAVWRRADVRRRDVQRNGTWAGGSRGDRTGLRAARSFVAALLAVATVGCGIIELEVEEEDPDGLDPTLELEDAPDDLVEDVEQDAEDADDDTGEDDGDADDEG
jgi:hypothetical protein